MDKEKEPIIPDMKPSKEDIALRQKQLAARRAAAQRAAAVKARPVAVAGPAPKQTLALIALLVAIVMGGLAGFLFLQMQTQQQQLSNAQTVLRAQAENLKVLNEKLSVTGENANLSLEALKVMLKEHDGEIRKLWDVANKRNKANIASNEKAITTVQGQLSSLNKELKSALDKQQKGDAARDKKLAGLSSNEAALKNRIAKIEAEAVELPAENQLRIAQHSESIQSLEASLTRLQNSGGNVSDMKLEIEDIQIRLDRIQNALGGSAQ